MAGIRYRMLDTIKGYKPEVVNDKTRARYNTRAAKSKRLDNKTEIIQAARDLHYSPAVIKRLEEAKSNAELEHIMATERKRSLI